MSNVAILLVTSKIPYTISIPDGVTVRRNSQNLSGEDSVYIGDNLFVSFTIGTEYEFDALRINGVMVDAKLSSGSQTYYAEETYIVGAADVVITVDSMSGTNDESNLMSLCKSCHSSIHLSRNGR